MDTRTFDKLAVAMASGSSRRRVLGGLAAVLGVAVASPAVAQKGGNGKSKGGDKGNSGNAPGRNKVAVCRVLKDENGAVIGAELKQVPPTAVKAFVKQGGSSCSGTVVPACQKLVCNTDASCATEADEAKEGTSCQVDEDTPGTCASGICTPPTSPSE